MRQSVSNACFDAQHDNCGTYAPDGRPCACACHGDAPRVAAAPAVNIITERYGETGEQAGYRAEADAITAMDRDDFEREYGRADEEGTYTPDGERLSDARDAERARRHAHALRRGEAFNRDAWRAAVVKERHEHLEQLRAEPHYCGHVDDEAWANLTGEYAPDENDYERAEERYYADLRERRLEAIYERASERSDTAQQEMFTAARLADEARRMGWTGALPPLVEAAHQATSRYLCLARRATAIYNAWRYEGEPF